MEKFKEAGNSFLHAMETCIEEAPIGSRHVMNRDFTHAKGMFTAVCREYEEALGYFTECQNIIAAHYGSNSDMMREIIEQKGVVYALMGDLKKAERAMKLMKRL